jgi:hypothetical protein
MLCLFLGLVNNIILPFLRQTSSLLMTSRAFTVSLAEYIKQMSLLV